MCIVCISIIKYGLESHHRFSLSSFVVISYIATRTMGRCVLEVIIFWYVLGTRAYVSIRFCRSAERGRPYDVCVVLRNEGIRDEGGCGSAQRGHPYRDGFV